MRTHNGSNVDRVIHLRFADFGDLDTGRVDLVVAEFQAAGAGTMVVMLLAFLVRVRFFALLLRAFLLAVLIGAHAKCDRHCDKERKEYCPVDHGISPYA